MKDSIKREQSQAGLSFAERKNQRSLAGGESNFRPKVKRNKVFLLLALLLTAATGAWATDVYLVGNGTGNWLNGAGWDPGVAGNKMTEQNGVYSITFNDVDANSELLFKFALNGTWDVNYGSTSWDANELNKTLSNIEEFGNNIAFGLTEKADVTISFNLSELTYMISTKGMKVGDDAASGYTVSMKDGVKDADKWTITPNPAEEGQTVTLQYNGRLKVKGVKATSDAAESDGALSGVFSLSDTKQVNFSKGNLQLVGENTLQFAENQWDYFGDKQSDNHRDLFCWGTGNNPNQTTGNSTFTDWGDNTYLQATLGKGWRTMTKDEFIYVFNHRASGSSVFGIADGRYTTATINTDGTGVNGFILFPDGITIEASEVTTAGTINNKGTVTQCTTAQWAALAKKGCVFLPAGGYFLPVNGAGAGYGDITDYWSSTAANASKAHNLNFNFGYPQGGVNPASNLGYNYGCSVRLVREVAASDEPAAKTPATVTTAPTGAAVVGVGKTTELVSGGAADGGTLMYAVTTTNTKPTSTDGFSDAVPTAETLAAGTYYVWYYVKGDATHTDSEISATAIAVTVKAATITVTWNNNDITGSGKSFTKDGVTITAVNIDFSDKNFLDGGTFSTTLGNFTKIEVTAYTFVSFSGTGWSGNSTKQTWTGTPASSVSFSGSIYGMDNAKLVFTIEPTN